MTNAKIFQFIIEIFITYAHKYTIFSNHNIATVVIFAYMLYFLLNYHKVDLLIQTQEPRFRGFLLTFLPSKSKYLSGRGDSKKRFKE